MKVGVFQSNNFKKIQLTKCFTNREGGILYTLVFVVVYKPQWRKVSYFLLCLQINTSNAIKCHIIWNVSNSLNVPVFAHK